MGARRDLLKASFVGNHRRSDQHVNAHAFWTKFIVTKTFPSAAQRKTRIGLREVEGVY